MTLTIFYDGQCPLCSREINALRIRDVQRRLVFIDISKADFIEKHPDIDPINAQKRLHGKLEGNIIYGLDVTYWAWCLVGKSTWVAPLRWPLIRPLLNSLYQLFARHRYKVARWLFSSERCHTGSCGLSESHKND